MLILPISLITFFPLQFISSVINASDFQQVAHNILCNLQQFVVMLSANFYVTAAALFSGCMSHSTQNTSFRRRFLKPVSGLGMEKTKPNTTKAHIHQSKEMHCNTKKLKPGLVASYDIQPGNGAGLFSKEKIGKEGDKEKVKNKSLKGQGKHMTN